MATSYGKHLSSARSVAAQDGVPDGIVDARIGRFESLFQLNPSIAQRLEEVGLLAAACNRVALGAKFDATEIEQRLAQASALTEHQRVEGKLCLMNIGLLE